MAPKVMDCWRTLEYWNVVTGPGEELSVRARYPQQGAQPDVEMAEQPRHDKQDMLTCIAAIEAVEAKLKEEATLVEIGLDRSI